MTLRAMLMLVLATGAASPAGVHRYSDEPLRQKPLMSTAEVAVDFTRFNNWLAGRIGSLTPDRFAGPREHAYLLIDSILKQKRSEGRSEFNGFEKMTLGTLFGWASRLGVYGAGMAAQWIGADAGPPPEPLPPPAPFELRLDAPNFVLSSRSSPWRLEFPYYFMFFEARRFTARNGLPTELIITSTSFAGHAQDDGRSQATIMFIYSPESDCPSFDRFWLDQVGIGPDHRSPEAPLPGSSNYRYFDEEHRMRKEITFAKSGVGCVAFALMGIDGTYQANRESYLDFLEAARFPPPAVPPPEAGGRQGI